MARRNHRNAKGLINWLLNSPAYVSVLFTLGVFSLLKWGIPHFLSGSPMLTMLSKYIAGLAPISFFFLVPGLFSLIRASKIDANSAAWITRPSHASERREAPLIEKTEPLIQKSPPPVKLPQWDLSLIREIEWKRFEMLCGEYFRVLGKRVETLDHGADGGIDARIYKNHSSELEFAIQCKAWKKQVGVKEVRELFGVMAHESAGKGIFMTTSTFTAEATKFAKDHATKLFLIDGEKLLHLIKKLPGKSQDHLYSFVTKGDFTTPTCASCGIKMVQRQGKSGSFWGCKNYPKCKTTLKIA